MDNRSLEEEFERLRIERASFETQEKLFENFIEIARTSTEVEMKSTLQKTLDLAIEQTGAERGAIFLFDADGRVTDSILTRENSEPEARSRLVGVVLGKGLAGWAIRNRRAGLITDTETDARWLALPDQPYQARSALAVPIIKGDEVLGVITLLHSAPEKFNQTMTAAMQGTADHIGLALENIRLYVKLNESHRSLEAAKRSVEAYARALDAELARGRQIQRNFLPAEIPKVPGWEFASFFHPARQVSGDLYDVFSLGANRIGLVIGDVCDKGVGSALYMALFRSLLRVFSGAYRQPDSDAVPGNATPTAPMTAKREEVPGDPLDAVALTNSYIAKVHGGEAMFATLFFGVLDPATGRMRYINGGHEPLIVIRDGSIENTLAPTGPAVGVLPDIEFRKAQIELAPGAMMVGYTDGVTDASSPTGELFSKRRLQEILERPAASARNLIEILNQELNDFIGLTPQSDDITLLLVRRAATD